ncbi:MAG TPA: VOC family protein [Gammaproteobacteria bacterium]|nr:VOC family protein [Gammaproteobacteria bacterium]
MKKKTRKTVKKKTSKGTRATKARKVSFIPKGYATVTPYLIVHDGKAALEFYRQVLGAKVLMTFPMGDKLGHAELRVGDSLVMLADEFPESGAVSPRTVGGSPVNLMVYVKDCDKVIERAVQAGATLTQAADNKFYGDRSGTITDPFGHRWTIATHIEDVTPREIKKRMAAMQAGGGASSPPAA